MKCFLTVVKKSFSPNVLLIMKFTALFLLIFTFQVSAKGYGQDRISLRLKKTEISDILRTIEKQTTYRFLYNASLQDIRDKVSIDVKDASLTDVLGQLFERTRLSYQLMNDNLIVIKEDQAVKPDVTIQGTVTGEGGMALAGASVQVKGTTIGTTTNNDGKFSLTLPDANATLIISSIGYDPQEVALEGKTEVTIALTVSTKEIEQVVVVGYGTSRKKDVTGSTVNVKGADLA